MKKISVAGGGNTGITTALFLAFQNLGDIVVLDLPEMENVVKGKVLDISQAIPLLHTSSAIYATSDYRDTANSDLVIVTAGRARKPGMTRTDLISANAEIVRGVIDNVVRYSPNAVIIMLTNPIEVMTHVAYKQSEFPRSRVFGQGAILDGARFCCFVAEELDVSPQDVSTIVLGVHGDEMMPMTRYSRVGSVPLEMLLSKEKLDAIISRTKGGGTEIINLLGTGSSHYAPAASLAVMAEAILLNQRRIIPVTAVLDGEYGYTDVALSVPVVLGSDGIEKIIELDLLKEERAILDKSAEVTKKLILE